MKRQFPAHRAFWLTCAFLAILGFSANIGGQTISGSITGTVEDAQGNVIPGANVTAINGGKNTSAKTLTNSQGHFVFPNLLPGHYTVDVERAGKHDQLCRSQQSHDWQFALQRERPVDQSLRFWRDQRSALTANPHACGEVCVLRGIY